MARISVVDDYPEFLAMMLTVFEGEGHTVAGFDGDDMTIDELVASHPDLLIVDLRIAGGAMKGWDIAVLARGDERLRQLPLIVCSADVRTLRDRRDEFHELGNVYTLEKPFDLETAVSLVSHVLQEASSMATAP